MTGAYLMYKKGIKCYDLQKYMIKIRPIVDLLPGLYEVLIIYQEALEWFEKQKNDDEKASAASSSTANVEATSDGVDTTTTTTTISLDGDDAEKA
jgi:hypothetical protein